MTSYSSYRAHRNVHSEVIASSRYLWLQVPKTFAIVQNQCFSAVIQNQTFQKPLLPSQPTYHGNFQCSRYGQDLAVCIVRDVSDDVLES